MEKEKELGIMVKRKRGGVMELHLFPSKEAMRKYRGEDSERDVGSEYKEWVLPLEEIEGLFAASGGK